MAVGEYIESEPEAVWEFIRRWGGHPQEDLRAAVATCLLEHLLEFHFAAYFPRVEELARADLLFGDMFQLCWQFGQAKEPGNAERFKALMEGLGSPPNPAMQRTWLARGTLRTLRTGRGDEPTAAG